MIQTKLLKECINQIRGISYDPKEISDIKLFGYVPLLKANNITDRGLDTSDLIYILTEKVNSQQFIKKGDILIASSSGSKKIVGKHIYFEDDYEGSFGAFCKVIRPNNKIYPRYLDALLKSSSYRQYIEKVTTGANINNLKNEDIDNFKINIFPIKEQIRISTILSKVEFLIQKRQESIVLLDELVSSVFNRLFGDPVKNEKKWRTAILQDLCTKIGSGATPRGGKQNYKQEGISLIRSLNVYNGRFEYKDLAFIDEEQAKSLDNVIVEEDDVLLTITGASVARSCIVPTDILPARVNQHVSIIRTDKEKINSVFLNYTLINKNYQVLLLKIAKLNGATREALTKEDVCSLIISLPPLSLQNQFAEIVQKAEAIKQCFQKSLEELNYLYQSLSQRAFQGKLDLSRLDVEEELEKFQEKQQIKMQESVENMLLRDSAVYYDVPPIKEPTDKLSQSVSEFPLSENTAGREKGYRLFNIEQIAESIKKRYTGFHFSFEMLYRFLSRELFLDVPYYSSEELKKRPSLNSEQDIRWFIYSAIVNVDRGENERRLLNPFIRLEQHFYNAEKENMTLRLVDEDYQLLRKRNKKERSGIYFSIKET